MPGLAFNLDELLSPASEEPPCGANLEYDERYYEIERAATRTAPQDFGGHHTEAQEPKWPAVVDLSKTFLGHSKDLRVAVYLARGLVQTSGVPGLAAGVQLIHGLLDRYWDGVHPALEEGGDATMRLSALSALSSLDAFLSDLRDAEVVNSGVLGRLRVRDIETALGRLPPVNGAAVPALAQLHAEIGAAIQQGNGSRDALREALSSLGTIQKLLTEKVGHDRAPDFKSLTDLLSAVKKVCDEAAGDEVTDEAADAGGSAPGAGLASGQIRSREDAIRMLDRVCEYLERHEPANPAPLLIRRAQRLMTKNFLDIVKDLLPDSVSTVETLAGNRE